VGTSTLQNNRVGRTTLGKVVAGVRPDANPTAYGKSEVTVDTIIYARDNVDLLDAAQSNFNTRAELGQDHGKEMAKHFDQSFIIKCIHGAQSTPADDLNGAFGAGKNETSDYDAGATTKIKGDLLGADIKAIIVQMEEEDIDADELVVLVRPTQYQWLTATDLVNVDLSRGNGDLAQGVIERINGARIIKTARIPTVAITDHLLGPSYNVTAQDAKARAVVLHPKSLLAGETIPLTSQSYYDQKELQHFVDTHMAYGVNVNREDTCGAAFQS
jgi:hypothetical protein